MVKVYFQKDSSIDPLEKKTIAVIGYGSQGHAQAQNMRDSGLKVIIGLDLDHSHRTGGSWDRASNDDFKVYSISEATQLSDIIFILIPDMVQTEIYEKHIKSFLMEGKTLVFAHGFNIYFKQILPPKNVDVIMVAPKSPGIRVRETYIDGFGVPALIAIYHNWSGKAKEMALAVAKAIGCTRAGVLETTFKDETESDLIGEQIVLVGGLIELIRNGFEVLVENGYPPELAYFEACNEAKLIMDLIYQKGIIGMLKAVSDTAKYGGLTVGSKVIDEHVKENMRKAAKEVQNGNFAKEWLKEHKLGEKNLNSLMEKIEDHPLEKVGKFIRKTSGIEK